MFVFAGCATVLVCMGVVQCIQILVSFVTMQWWGEGGGGCITLFDLHTNAGGKGSVVPYMPGTDSQSIYMYAHLFLLLCASLGQSCERTMIAVVHVHEEVNSWQGVEEQYHNIQNIAVTIIILSKTSMKMWSVRIKAVQIESSLVPLCRMSPGHSALTFLHTRASCPLPPPPPPDTLH